MRVTYPTSMVLHALASGHGYGFEIIDVTGLAAGTVYPILRRLEAESLARSSWEEAGEARSEGRPARRNYRLTEEGAALERKALERYPAIAAQFTAAVKLSARADEG